MKGIPEEMQGRIFEPFVQGDVGLNRRHSGTGLGLSICSQLASLMRGSIHLQSTCGVGSTFTVRIPLRQVLSTPNAQVANDADGVRPSTPPSAIASKEKESDREDSGDDSLTSSATKTAAGEIALSATQSSVSADHPLSDGTGSTPITPLSPELVSVIPETHPANTTPQILERTGTLDIKEAVTNSKALETANALKEGQNDRIERAA